MRIDIIYGVYMLSEYAMEEITETLEDAGCKVGNVHIARQRKEEVEQALSLFSCTDADQLILVLSHGLEMDNPFTIDELLRYQNAAPNVKVILVVDRNMRGSDFLQAMYDNGMYHAIYYDDTNAKNICRYVVEGVDKEGANALYEVENIC